MDSLNLDATVLGLTIAGVSVVAVGMQQILVRQMQQARGGLAAGGCLLCACWDRQAAVGRAGLIKGLLGLGPRAVLLPLSSHSTACLLASPQ